MKIKIIMMLKVLQIICYLVVVSNNKLVKGSNLKTCERDYVKIGCYEEHNAKIFDLLINDRQNIQWNRIEAYMHHLACLCSQAAKHANRNRPKNQAFIGFALHYFGECYGRTKVHLDQLTRRCQSHRCIGDQTYTKCEEKHQECVGHDYAEYIYKFRDFTDNVDIDGGYTHWEQWSHCEGKCDMGIKRRERTCTNPEPKGKGKDCSSLGNSTERAQCETGKKCPALVSDEMNVTACEGDGISIHCRGDATIKITSAVFGRLSFAVCKPYNQNTWTKFCRAKQALNVVKQTCEGRSSCFVYANTGVFGEPCLGLEKYLQVTYRCKSRI